MNKIIFLVILLLPTKTFSDQLNPKPMERRPIANQYFAAIKNNLNVFQGQVAEHLLTLRSDQNDQIDIVKLTGKPKDGWQKDQSILWVQQNYEYLGDPREYEPNDPKFVKQYHHTVMHNDQAWDINFGNHDIIVAVTDDGIDLHHEDLQANLWINNDEIPNNNKDDDGNGYIDDVYGYDFIKADNDPNPETPSSAHGTHVAGIVAAVANNAKGTIGTAPAVKIMAVKFYGGGSWTSEVILKAYKYAADNGAKVITTSYNIDVFVDDQIFQSAVQYAYDHGVLHFNSAGNGSTADPERQKFEQLILTCSTIADNETNDALSAFSNWGEGIDLCAPGGGGKAGILSTIPGNKYDRKSGTSMASPNAAAVAALIWSYNPNWTREQVVAQLFATSDSIDEINPQYIHLLGAGRVNPYRALTETISPPKIFAIKNIPENATVTTIIDIFIQTKMVFDPKSVNDLRNYELRFAGNDHVFDTTDDQLIALTLNHTYMIGSQNIHLKTANLAKGQYRFKIKSGGLFDPFGNTLDGNGDGIQNDDFVRLFTVN